MPPVRSVHDHNAALTQRHLTRTQSVPDSFRAHHLHPIPYAAFDHFEDEWAMPADVEDILDGSNPIHVDFSDNQGAPWGAQHDMPPRAAPRMAVVPVHGGGNAAGLGIDRTAATLIERSQGALLVRCWYMVQLRWSPLPHSLL